MFKLQNNFNEQVFELRESKLILTSKIVAQKAELQEIQEELLPEFVKPLPIPPEIDVDTEFPERALKVFDFVTLCLNSIFQEYPIYTCFMKL